jgi:hypothetical protein
MIEPLSISEIGKFTGGISVSRRSPGWFTSGSSALVSRAPRHSLASLREPRNAAAPLCASARQAPAAATPTACHPTAPGQASARASHPPGQPRPSRTCHPPAQPNPPGQPSRAGTGHPPAQPNPPGQPSRAGTGHPNRASRRRAPQSRANCRRSAGWVPRVSLEQHYFSPCVRTHGYLPDLSGGLPTCDRVERAASRGSARRPARRSSGGGRRQG